MPLVIYVTIAKYLTKQKRKFIIRGMKYFHIPGVYHMDTLKIKAFLLADQYNSFSKAAVEFGYTPSALSHIMDSLEADLGVKLFIRSHNGVRTTEAGQQLKEYFRNVLTAENTLYEAAAAFNHNKEGSLRIGTYQSMAAQILPELLGGFKKTYPRVKTSILVANNLRTWLEQNLCDVVFSDVCPDGAVKWYPIMEDEYVAVVPANTFSGRRSIRREELYDYSFIQTPEKKLADYFDYNSFQDIVRLNSIEEETAVSLVREQIGVAVLPRLTVRKRSAGVRILHIEPQMTRTLGFAVKSGPLTGAAAWFTEYLQQSIL